MDPARPAGLAAGHLSIPEGIVGQQQAPGFQDVQGKPEAPLHPLHSAQPIEHVVEHHAGRAGCNTFEALDRILDSYLSALPMPASSKFRRADAARDASTSKVSRCAVGHARSSQMPL